VFKAVGQRNLFDAIINVQYITHIFRVIAYAGYIECDIRIKAIGELGEMEKKK
jgi:hypothetical protein